MKQRLRRLLPAFAVILVSLGMVLGPSAVRSISSPHSTGNGPALAAPGAGRAGSGSGRTSSPAPGIVVRHAVKRGISAPLRTITPVAPTPYIEKEPGVLPHAGNAVQHAVDGALQTTPPSQPIPPTSRNFEGQDVGADGALFVGAPPDTEGDVGPNNYVQFVNVFFTIYDKDGNALYGPADGNTLFSGFGGLCELTNDGDPIVQYDPLADRWMFTQFAFARDEFATGLPVPPYHQCFAVSTTSDPTGSYYLYDFEISQTKLNDYPHIGVWPDAYYMSINQFNSGTLDFAGAGALAFERRKMLLGQDAQMVYFDESAFDPDLVYGGQLPADLDGTTPPAAGEPNFFMQFSDSNTAGQDKLLLWKFHVDWATPANSTFGNGTTQGTPVQIPVADFDSNLCDHGNTRGCIPEKDTTAPDDNLDSIPDRLMYRLAYRNFGDHEVILANHTVNAGGGNVSHAGAGIRWYEVRDPNGTPSVFQQGTFAPDATDRWMGSLAMDSAGDIAMGYSASDAASFPSIRYVGRLVGDPLGQMTRGEGTVIQGTGSQVGTSNRWGDYSSLSVDPDGCTFWFTSEYYQATGSFGWATRVGAFSFPTCGDPQIGLSGPASAPARSNVTYTATVVAGEGTASLATVTDPLPAGMIPVSATSTVGTCSLGTTVTCALGNLAPGQFATVTITARTGQAGAVDNTVHLGTSSADANLANNVATVHTQVQDACQPPGITVVSDGAGDSTDMQGQHDLRAISVAEPFQNGGPNKLVFTLKVADLSGTLTPNTSWPIYFSLPDHTGRFVDMRTDASSAVSYHYGTVGVEGPTGTFGYYGGTTDQGTADAGSFLPDGTIRITVADSKFGLNPGNAIDKFQSRISVDAVAGSFTPDNAPNSTTAPAGSYTLAGNAVCQPADLTVTNIDSPDPVAVGSNLTYAIHVTNQGPGSAPGTVLFDQLPAGLSFVSASPGCAASGSSVLCDLGTLASGASPIVNVVVKPTSQAGSPVSDTATASSSAPDPTIPASGSASTQVSGLAAKKCPGYLSSSLHQVVGTSVADVLTGTDGIDVICGLGGNDTLYGLGGNDILIGGTGNDVFYAGTGSDTVKGGSGNDTAYGEEGIDSLKGDAGDDLLWGGPGNDVLIGNKGADRASGEADDDTLRLQDNVYGNDSGDGGDGSDTCLADKQDHVVNCEAR